MKAKHLFIEVTFLLTLILLLPAFSLAQGTWTQKADFAGGARYTATGFSIGTKAYVGLGTDDVFSYLDFWEWDPATNVWTRKADFWPGTFYEVSFSIGTKGYLLSGTGYNGIPSAQGFWEYDPVADTWTQKASLPTNTNARLWAVGFSIGTKGYIGIGQKIDGAAGSYYQDFWEYDQATNTWTQKADFKGVARVGAVGFSIGNKGYIGTGYNGTGTAFTREFWEWDQATNVWTQKSDFGGTARSNAVGFSIGSKGYIGTGYDDHTNSYNDLWEWDQTTDVWRKKADFGGTARYYAVGFSIGNKGYIGTGEDDNNGSPTQDFWEFDPLETTGIGELSKENSSVYPNPASDIINFNFNTQNNVGVTMDIYNDTGKLVKTELLEPGQQQINVADLRNGIYMVDIRCNNWSNTQKLIIQR